jgi:hypothetical protein
MASESTVFEGIDYGPLFGLIGSWQGDKGKDLSPKPDGEEESPYYETILYEAIGDVTNAGSQTLAVLRYHQVVTRKSDDQVFHNETGYWCWDSKTGVVMHSLTIPRGLALLAGGKGVTKNDGSTEINVTAEIDSKEWGIVQSPFMRENARTIGFRHNLVIKGEELSYDETTVLEIYSKTFDHTDSNILKRTG